MNASWIKHLSSYGQNKVTRSQGCKCKCSFMPLFYIFLLCICAGVTVADNMLYEYDWWYVQGAAMVVMVLMASLIFGCGRSRYSKIEEQQRAEREANPEEAKPVLVTRNGIQVTIDAKELTVGDKICITANDTVPCDCAIYAVGDEVVVEESVVSGSYDHVRKQSLNAYNNVALSTDTVLYS